MDPQAINRFNVRVYGLLIEKGQLLLCDEIAKGKYLTKFPGGGLEYGEGLHECLVREFLEEARIQVEVMEHFYTTDHFVQSAFEATDQLISIYYTVRRLPNQVLRTIEKPFAFDHQPGEEPLAMRWAPISEETLAELTLPLDKIAMKKLLIFE